MFKMLLFIVLLTIICGCGLFSKNNIEPAYWKGEGWYNPDKTEKEYKNDLYECLEEVYRAPSEFTKITVNNRCMRDRGYVWKQYSNK